MAEKGHETALCGDSILVHNRKYDLSSAWLVSSDCMLLCGDSKPMKFGLPVRFAILTGVLAGAHAQTHNPFQAAYDANQVFELRDAVEHSMAPRFTKGPWRPH
jgi:hypothetical protein